MLKRSALPLTLVLSIFCLGASAAAAQPPAATPVPGAAPQPAAANAQDEADHAALRKLRAIYEQAVRDNRIDAMQPYLHSDFHGVMVTGRPVNSFADLQQYWRDIRALIGEGGSYTTTLKPELSTLMGDVALARGTSDDVVRTGEGKEFRFTTYWSATLQREGGGWKLRHVQGTMDPISNPFVQEFARRALIRTSAIGILAGLIVGMAFGLVWQRRRARKA